MAFVAVTVKMDESPEAIDVGFAAMLTVGAADTTVTVAALVAVFPPAPVAVAV